MEVKVRIFALTHASEYKISSDEKRRNRHAHGNIQRVIDDGHTPDD